MAFRVGGKLIACMRHDLDSLAIRIEFGEREMLLEGEPDTFFITEHYRNYPMLLVRLAKVHPDKIQRLLVNAWRRLAPQTRAEDRRAKIKVVNCAGYSSPSPRPPLVLPCLLF